MESVLGRIVAAVLGLLALAAVGLIIYKGFSIYKVNAVTSDITQVVTNARGQFVQGANGYTNFTTANEAAMNVGQIFPSDMMRGNVVYDAWGNQVTLGSANGATQGTIGFGGGNSETVAQCEGVVTSLKDYVTLAVGGQVFTPTNQPDEVSAANACDASLAMTLTFQ